MDWKVQTGSASYLPLETNVFLNIIFKKSGKDSSPGSKWMEWEKSFKNFRLGNQSYCESWLQSASDKHPSLKGMWVKVKTRGRQTSYTPKHNLPGHLSLWREQLQSKPMSQILYRLGILSNTLDAQDSHVQGILWGRLSNFVGST